jgi:hypothetical protein
MAPPLNLQLFHQLERLFGNVIVANIGEPMKADYERAFDGRVKMRVVSPGEYYRISCPYCADRRHRLYVNHRWGLIDSKTKTRNRWLAKCFNENCLANEENRDSFFERLGLAALLHPNSRPPCPAPPVSTATVPILPVGLPSDFARLDALPDDHPAVEYVRNRRFGPEKIASIWGVGFSQEVGRSTQGRLVIPVYVVDDGQRRLVGWQARVIDNSVSSKYLTATGMKKSRVLYGMHRLPDTGPIIVCEGPLDVWRFGRGAVALFGKTASVPQVDLLLEHGAGRPWIVALDGDARDDAEALASRLEEIRQTQLLRPDKSPVYVLKLARDRDPADYSRKRLMAMVETLMRP